MTIKNSSTLPRVYFGMHMVPGCAEYRDTGEPYRIFINEATIKSMDSTFQGRPVYVQHVDTVDLDKLQHEADGYVIRSFYNSADGKHWAEFIVVSDKGHEAIRNGWRLSNAYIPKDFAGGGLWNGIDYAKEVTRGEYEHLAIVPNPRYDESVIFTPEQFKEYNEKKTLELKRLANSKGEETVFKFFKKEKVENSSDLSAYSVVLESSKKEVSVAEAIQIADKYMNMNGYANGDHMVKVGSDEMSVNDLAKKYSEMKNAEDEVKKKNAEDEEKKKKENEGKEEEKKENEDGDLMENGEEKKEEEKKENEDEEKEVKKNAFAALRNAEKTAKRETKVVHVDKLSRGKARYGSN